MTWVWAVMASRRLAPFNVRRLFQSMPFSINHLGIHLVPRRPQRKLGIIGAHRTPEFHMDEAALLPRLKLTPNQLLDYLERHR